MGISFTAMAIAGNTEAMEMAQRDAENNTALVKYDAMCRAIDAAYRVDEVKEIRDKAAALEHYSRLAKNTENERRACEIRLRAERKAGQLLAKTRKAKAGRPPKGKSIVRDDITRSGNLARSIFQLAKTRQGPTSRLRCCARASREADDERDHQADQREATTCRLPYLPRVWRDHRRHLHRVRP